MTQIKLHQRAAWLLFVLVVAACLVMAIWFPRAYIVATYEDLLGEWLQVFLFVFALYYSTRLAIARSRFRIFFALLALACFYVAMEEISWGQRLLNIPTPEFFDRHNLQQETNLHNFLVGPLRTTTKTVMEFTLAAGLVLFGLAYPLAMRRQWRAAAWLETRGLPAPPLYVWPCFALSAVLELHLLRFNEAEIAELLVSIGLVMFAMHYWVAHRYRVVVHDTASWGHSVSARLTVCMGVSFLGAATLALATTSACYASPRLRTSMEERYLNGIEKFAARYARYEQWDTAARLYHMVNDQEPGRASILRELALCYRTADNPKKFNHYNRLALAVDLERLAEQPDGISVNLSLSRTYRQRGDKELSERHLGIARQSALEWARNEPDDAGAAYWLGKISAQSGDTISALTHFKLAAELQPESLKYRKAYYRAKRASDKSGEEDE